MDVWHVLDEFHFAHKTLEGDGTVSARIDSLEPVGQMTKAGLMMRSMLDPTSKHTSVYLRPGGVIEFRHRASECGSALSRSTCIRNLKLPHWLMLKRHGHTFTAHHSSDGILWQEPAPSRGDHHGRYSPYGPVRHIRRSRSHGRGSLLRCKHHRRHQPQRPLHGIKGHFSAHCHYPSR